MPEGHELCRGEYTPYLTGGTDPEEDLHGVPGLHLVRGGGWNLTASQCRSAYRSTVHQAWSDQGIKEPVGFRLVLAHSTDEPEITTIQPDGFARSYRFKQLKALTDLQSQGIEVGARSNEKNEITGLQIRPMHGRPNKKLGDTALALAKDLPHVEYLDASTYDWYGDYGVTDEGIKNLQGLERLKELRLAHCYRVTDKGLKYLEGLEQLKSLDIRFTGITTQGLSSFQRARPHVKVHIDPHGLRLNQVLTMEGAQVRRVESRDERPIVSVDLSGTKATDADLLPLAAVETLGQLNLSGTQITDVGLKNSLGPRGLSSLNLSHTKVTDAGLAELALLRRLSTLNLSSTPVTGAGLKRIVSPAPIHVHRWERRERFYGIRNLDLSDTKLTDEGLEGLRSFPILHSLNLSSTEVTGARLAEYVVFQQQVASLNLSNTKLVDENLKSLPHCQMLDLSHNNITSAGLKSLEVGRLVKLNLSHTELSDEGLKDLSARTGRFLREIDLSHTMVTDAGLKDLAVLPRMEHLYLDNCTNVTDSGLKELAGVTALRTLALSGTQVTDAGLKHLAGLNSLQKLNLRGIKVTNQGLKELRNALPKCQMIR